LPFMELSQGEYAIDSMLFSKISHTAGSLISPSLVCHLSRCPSSVITMMTLYISCYFMEHYDGGLRKVNVAIDPVCYLFCPPIILSFLFFFKSY
jgi:hypothetical protein